MALNVSVCVCVFTVVRLCTCRTRLIHWKLSSSVESGRCSATTTIRSSCSTVMENTAILRTNRRRAALLSKLKLPPCSWHQTGDERRCAGNKLMMCENNQEKHKPAPVNKFHGLHRQSRGNNVVGIMPTTAHHHQAVHLSRHEDQPCWSDEAQQAGPCEGELTDGSAAAGYWKNLPSTATI